VSSTLVCMFELMKRQLYVFSKTYWQRLLDMCIIFSTNLIVFGYFLPLLDKQSNYGIKILFAAIATFGLFEIIGKVANLIGDITSDRLINNFIILPIPSSLVFLSIALSWAIESIILTIPLFALGNIIFLNQISYAEFSVGLYTLLFFSANLFYGLFCLWISSVIKDLRGIGIIWCRIVNPMFMFGCFFYPWQTVNHFAPGFGAIELVNPLVYINEGARAASMGAAGSLSIWLCIGMIWLFSAIAGLDGIRRMKKRLDCV
jgi:ABC-2 type transport system permease protein